MSIRQNINKIHYELSNIFESVKIEEKSNIKFGNYFEISSINRGLEVKMIITKKDLESNNIKWWYFSNPLDTNSHLVERNSDINIICEDVKEIIEKRRFSDDYLKNNSKMDIKWIFDFISKSVDDTYDCQIKLLGDKVICKNNNYEIIIRDNGQPNNFFIVTIKRDGKVIQASKRSKDGKSYSNDEIPSESILILLSRYFQNK